MLGWTVLSQLKQDPATRHIPVQIVTLDEDRQHGLARGAFSFLTKPTTTEGLEQALAQDQGLRRAAPQAPAGGRGQSRRAAEHHRAAGARRHRHRDGRLRRRRRSSGCKADPADCVVLDLRLPDMSGFEVLEQMRDDAGLADMPVVVFTGRELTAEEDARLHTMARSVVVKGVESPERLLDETALFLHRVVADLPREKQRMLERLHSLGRGPGRPHGAAGRRRRAQHLRAVQRAGAARHEGADRDHRQRGGLDRRVRARHRHRADGHHDAGDGRLRDHRRRSARTRRSGGCRSSP